MTKNVKHWQYNSCVHNLHWETDTLNLINIPAAFNTFDCYRHYWSSQKWGAILLVLFKCVAVGLSTTLGFWFGGHPPVMWGGFLLWHPVNMIITCFQSQNVFPDFPVLQSCYVFKLGLRNPTGNTVSLFRCAAYEYGLKWEMMLWCTVQSPGLEISIWVMAHKHLPDCVQPSVGTSSEVTEAICFPSFVYGFSSSSYFSNKVTFDHFKAFSACC